MSTPPVAPGSSEQTPLLGSGHLRADSEISLKASQSLYALKYPDSSSTLRGFGKRAGSPYRKDDHHIADWPSMLVVFLAILVSEAARGLILPSLWPYLLSLGGAKETLGVVVASFSLGRMMATIPFGFLSDHFSTQAVLVIASVIQILGHSMYVIAPSISAIVVARVIVGLGSATMSVCRAHVAKSTTKGQRTYFFAYLSALQFVGFAVLPGLGGLLDMLPEGRVGVLELNEITYPALFLVLANLGVIGVAYCVYRDPESVPTVADATQVVATSGPVTNGVPNGQAQVQIATPVEPDWAALMVCLLINVFFRGVVAELETITTPVLMEYFSLSLPGASGVIGLLGFVGLFIYLGFKPIAKRFSDRFLVFFAIVLTLAGSFVLAQSLFRPPLLLYVVGLGAIWSIAYPLGQTATLALFSKVLAGLPAGGFLGVFSATGSLARIGFALLAAGIWSAFGKRAVFSGIAIYALATALIGFRYWKRLVPPDGL